jgi:hypothetical protein
MGIALSGEIVKDRAQLEREWEQLFDDDAVAPLERREPRAVEELQHEVRAISVENHVEGPDERGVGELPEGLRLVCKAHERRRVPDLTRPDDLDDDERVQPVVPGQVGLVPPPLTEQPYRVAAGGDLVALAEAPAVGLPPGRFAHPSSCIQGR